MGLKETDLYEPVKIWLESMGFEVFPEVRPYYGSQVIDVVGLRPKSVACVELKTCLNLNVMEQALHNIWYSNFSFVAVPHARKNRRLAEQIIRKEGLGLLNLYFFDDKFESIDLTIPPKCNRRQCDTLIKICDDYHKKIAKVGGRSGGGYATGYKIMIAKIKEFLKCKIGGATIDEILQKVPTHYNSPRSSLILVLRKFESSWCGETSEYSLKERKFYIKKAKNGAEKQRLK